MRYRFFLLPTLFCWAFAAMAATPKAKVDVHVTTAAGDPIEHAEVAVKVVKGEKATTIWRVHTNEDGIAKPPAEAEIRQGKILVEVMADEYETFSQTFDVNEPHQSIDVKLRTALVQASMCT
jgi:5-hydroxyisourate hydrolase-like protein (transthyretin family)